MSGSEANILEPTAILHDAGYGSSIAHTGFPPLDEANFLHGLNTPARLIHLVARHSYAALEACLPGYSAELSEFITPAKPELLATIKSTQRRKNATESQSKRASLNH